jgi:hypothetical protein
MERKDMEQMDNDRWNTGASLETQSAPSAPRWEWIVQTVGPSKSLASASISST